MMPAASVPAGTTTAPRPRPISLFWRTFGLVALLIVASFVAMLAAARLLERAPPEQRLAWEIASVVNLTRSALVSAEPDRRLQLLDELAQQEEVRVLPKEPGDRIDPSATGPRLHALEPRLRALLGRSTQVAGRVNGIDAVWISFEIDGDDYWLILPRDRVERQFGPSLALLSLIAAAFALVGALVISRLVNRPLSDLAGAIGVLSRGRAPAPLAESGPTEIAAVNRHFNRLAVDLAQLEADRALALAGISHDIRNPLARLRMEVELAPLAEAQRASMVEDIERIDRIVGQFIGYAQIAQPPRAELVDVSSLLASIANAYRGEIESGALALAIDADEALRWHGDPTDLQRVIGNVIDNALHYGRNGRIGRDGDGIGGGSSGAGSPGGTGIGSSDTSSLGSGSLGIGSLGNGGGNPGVHVELHVRQTPSGIALALRDDGPGIPEEEAERLLRPFTRVDRARDEHGGSGLGLAIVDRLARRYGGRARLSNDVRGGLRVEIDLPDYRNR